MAERIRDIRFLLCVCAIAAIPFLPALSGGFTNWDDDVNVTNNPFVHAGVRDGLLPLLTRPYEYLYVPVAYAAFWAAYHLWGNAPLGFHALNLACHVVSAVLFYQVLKSILKSRWAALLACGWWAAHPLQVETVAWITGLKDALSGMLALACWRLYIAWRAQPEDSSSPAEAAALRRAGAEAAERRRALFGASLLAFLLACLAKPCVAFPLALAGYDLLIGRRKSLRALAPLALFFAVSAAIICVTLRAQPAEQGGVQMPHNPAARLLIAADTATFYLGKLAWPASLCPVYGRSIADALSMPGAAARVALLCAALGAAILLGRRWQLGAAVFVAGWAPISGLVAFGYMAVSTVADRYAYLPALGAALAVGDLIARFESGKEGAPRWPGWTARGAACVWILALAAASWSQTAVWRDSVAVWKRTLECNPHPAARVLANDGSALYRSNRMKEAAGILQECVRDHPEYAPGHYNLAVVLQAQGRYEAAKSECRMALELDSSRPRWWVALGAMDAAMKDYAGCVEASERALSLDAHNATAALNLGLAELELRRPAEAAKALATAVQEAPENYEARFQLAEALEMSGRAAEARAEFSKVAAAPSDQTGEALRAEAAANAKRLGGNGRR